MGGAAEEDDNINTMESLVPHFRVWGSGFMVQAFCLGFECLVCSNKQTPYN